MKKQNEKDFKPLLYAGIFIGVWVIVFSFFFPAILSVWMQSSFDGESRIGSTTFFLLTFALPIFTAWLFAGFWINRDEIKKSKTSIWPAIVNVLIIHGTLSFSITVVAFMLFAFIGLIFRL
ncbi:MAG: hypothetical protein V4611_04410 [Patescibacteria group bacterium]